MLCVLAIFRIQLLKSITKHCHFDVLVHAYSAFHYKNVSIKWVSVFTFLYPPCIPVFGWWIHNVELLHYLLFSRQLETTTYCGIFQSRVGKKGVYVFTKNVRHFQTTTCGLFWPKRKEFFFHIRGKYCYFYFSSFLLLFIAVASK